MDSPPRPSCCLWQLFKKKKSEEPRNSNKKNLSNYYGDWGVDGNIDAENSIFPKKKQEKDKKKDIKQGKKK